MRRAIGEPCRPAALAFLGLEERDAVDLEESLGHFDEIRTSGLGLGTLFHGLFRGSWRLGLLSLLPGPGPSISLGRQWPACTWIPINNADRFSYEHHWLRSCPETC